MSNPIVVPGRFQSALIGGGFIGPIHVEALRRLGVRVAGVLGSSPERTRPLAERLGIPRVYGDLDDLLSDEDVQVVHVASPNRAHFEQVRRILMSGRHVVCEKPLTISASESGELLRLSRARPERAAAVNYNIRFYPLCREMRERVRRGDVGRVLSVTGSYTQDWLLGPDDYNWRVDPDGGTNLRAVADIGTHWLDLAQHVVGKPVVSVLADLATFHRERNRPVGGSETFSSSGTRPGTTRAVPITTEDYGAVLLRWEDDARGAFHVSQTFAGRKNHLRLEVAGTEGALCWDSESPEQLWIGRRGRANEVLPRDPSLLAGSAAALCGYPGGHAEGFPDTFKQIFQSVYSWIEQPAPGGEDFPTFADGHHEILLCEAIAASAREERWVDVETQGADGASR